MTGTRAIEEAAMKPTTLYRFFDAAGQLLYVGIAGNPGRRFHQHAKTKHWWSEVASSTMEHFGTRRDAELAEIAAITEENPSYNVAHNQGYSITPAQGEHLVATNTHGTIDLTDRTTWPSGHLADGTAWWFEYYGDQYCELYVDWSHGTPPTIDIEAWDRKATLGVGAILHASTDDDLEVISGGGILPCPPSWVDNTLKFMIDTTAHITPGWWR